jgi:hypothetical protein
MWPASIVRPAHLTIDVACIDRDIEHLVVDVTYIDRDTGHLIVDVTYINRDTDASHLSM